ncbi:uncharacterized protein LOC132405140 isoform X1 [Hypanus sabinus]|uniref:uncharacterized protein LOC132405140 isoform X1 n=1 Tax=Hypanus sabinus TaxID=79690 RepID=UPI0028C4637F|nr:uncharacterized protein LOC132405140 isoform X1 [Hypanus sabinus]XP_059845822.1 uncharacterized protein LOC132405140 isoform X1 [Hypanus sabinus]
MPSLLCEKSLPTTSNVVASPSNSTVVRGMSLPGHDKYQSLKTRLLQTSGPSKSEHARQLLSLPGLSDGKPSELMDHKLSLLGKHYPCFIIKELSMQQKPDPVHTALANAPMVDNRELAKMADSLHSARQWCIIPPLFSTSISLVSKAPDIRTPVALKQMTPDLCFYHARFGRDFRKCRPPSSFDSASASGHRGSVNTVASSCQGRLLFTTDTLSGRRFLCGRCSDECTASIAYRDKTLPTAARSRTRGHDG